MKFEDLMPLRKYCRENDWPRLPQWNHWIYSKKPIAQLCIKKIGGRFMIDVKAFVEYVKNASLEEEE